MLTLDLTRASTEPLDFDERLELTAGNAGEDVVSVAGLEMRGAVERTARGFLARGDVAGRVALRCVRCLNEFTIDWAESFEVTLLPATSAPHDEETRLGRPELDVHFYAEPVLDLAELAGEQLALSLPMKPLCRDTCAGLCPHCGADLNQGACGCPSASDERWTPLAGWRPSN